MFFNWRNQPSVKKREEFKDITVDNASLKLNDIMTLVEDSKKSLDIFNKSFNTLDQAKSTFIFI